MTKSTRNRASRLLLLVASLALFAAACGGGAGPSSEEQTAAIAAASTNQAQLQLTADIASSQLLDTADGTIKSLADVITGDRPVLVWYWAPH